MQITSVVNGIDLRLGLNYAYNDIYPDFFMGMLTRIDPLYEPQVNEVFTFLCNDDKLTQMAMAVAEKSLHEDWDGEDDARWESFLKDQI